MKLTSTPSLNGELTNEELNQKLYTDAEFVELYARDKAHIEIQNQNQNPAIASVIEGAQVEKLNQGGFTPKIFEGTVQKELNDYMKEG